MHAKQVRIMKLNETFNIHTNFAKVFRKEMENLPFCFCVKKIKIGHVIEIGKVLHKVLIKTVTEENSTLKRAISKKVPVTTAKVLD